MRNKNVHRYIEEQNSEAKENLRKMTEKKLGFALSKETIADSEKKTLKVQKWVAIFATAACVICLLIALPFILKNFRELDDKTRYCKEEDYTWIWSDCNIKKYNQKHGENLLYIDNTNLNNNSIYDIIKNTDINKITPLEALKILENLKEIIQNEK